MADEFGSENIFKDFCPLFHFGGHRDFTTAFEHGRSDVICKDAEGGSAAACCDDREGKFMENVNEGFLHACCFGVGCLECCNPAGGEGVRVAFFFGKSAIESYVGAGGEVFGAGSESDLVKQIVKIFCFCFGDVEVGVISHFLLLCSRDDSLISDY